MAFFVVVAAQITSDEKQMDFAEQVESVAYVICGEELITFDKFCQIWHVKGVSTLAYQ